MGEILSSLQGNVSGGLLARVLQSVSSALNKNKRRVPLVGVKCRSNVGGLVVGWMEHLPGKTKSSTDYTDGHE